MVTTDDRETRVRESAQKFRAPFTLDPTLALYCPQDNVDALAHPRIKAWFDFVGQDYNPALPDVPHRVLLLLPCTRTKPYILSTEHKRINAALIAAGSGPMRRRIRCCCGCASRGSPRRCSAWRHCCIPMASSSIAP